MARQGSHSKLPGVRPTLRHEGREDLQPGVLGETGAGEATVKSIVTLFRAAQRSHKLRVAFASPNALQPLMM